MSVKKPKLYQSTSDHEWQWWRVMIRIWQEGNVAGTSSGNIHWPAKNCLDPYFYVSIQAWIAQLVAYRLRTMEVVGSYPGKGKDFSLKIWVWMLTKKTPILYDGVFLPH